MSHLSLSSVPSFLKRLKDPIRLFPDGTYSGFSFEAMHNQHLRIFKLLINRSVGYVGPRSLCTEESVTARRTIFSLKDGMLCWCTLLLASIENKLPVAGLHTDFLDGEPSAQ